MQNAIPALPKVLPNGATVLAYFDLDEYADNHTWPICYALCCTASGEYVIWEVNNDMIAFSGTYFMDNAKDAWAKFYNQVESYNTIPGRGQHTVVNYSVREASRRMARAMKRKATPYFTDANGVAMHDGDNVKLIEYAEPTDKFYLIDKGNLFEVHDRVFGYFANIENNDEASAYIVDNG